MEQAKQELKHDFHPRNNLQALTSLPHEQLTLPRPSQNVDPLYFSVFVQLTFISQLTCQLVSASKGKTKKSTTSNFQGVTSSPIVPRHKHSIVFIVHHYFFVSARQFKSDVQLFSAILDESRENLKKKTEINPLNTNQSISQFFCISPLVAHARGANTRVPFSSSLTVI